VRQLVYRVARTIADWGTSEGYFASADDGERFYRELAWLCLHQHGSFNSPVWFNVGLHHQYGITGDRCNWRWDPKSCQATHTDSPYEYPQASACFIQSVGDNMEDIMSLATSEAMLFKFDRGQVRTCRRFVRIARSCRVVASLRSVVFHARVRPDCGGVKSGGKTRRAAKMQSLKVWHPDILEFIECKWKEEKKAHVLIEKGGYEANFNGEAYSSILFQNANLSVRVTDELWIRSRRAAPGRRGG